MKIEKITPQIAALYLGQKCMSTFITNIGVWKVGDIFNGKITDETIASLDSDETEVELHLRRMDSLTEDEALELHTIVYGFEFSGVTACKDWFALYGDDLQCTQIEQAIGTPAAWLYLLSKGFDLFSLIDSGLAKEIKP